MFTKSFKKMRDLSAFTIPYSSSIGAIPFKNTAGTIRYTSPISDGNYCAYPTINMKQILTLDGSGGVFFSDVSEPFVDDGTVYNYNRASGINVSFQSYSYSESNGKGILSVRYLVNNTSSEVKNLYKFFANAQAPSTSTAGTNISTSGNGHYFLAYVKEINVSIPSNGTAIIDVTVETEIPE